jgi:hypothetical protein
MQCDNQEQLIQEDYGLQPTQKFWGELNQIPE